MSEDNKAKMRQFYEEVVQDGNFARLDDLVVPNFVDHDPAPGQAPGAEGIKQFFAALRAAVSDLRVSVEQMVAEGNKVAAHVSISGRHTGELLGLPPSGKEVVMRISDVVRIEDGKAVERWGVEDMSGFAPQG
jgi:predicted ester cyclase